MPPTIAIDGQALGREAARLFVEHAQGADRRPQVIDVGFRLVTRASG